MDFQPRQVPSRLYPPIAHNGVQISGFSSEQTAVHYDEQSLADLIFEIYPELSVPELARLKTVLDKLELPVEEVLLRYGFRENDLTQAVFDFVASLPMEIQEALSEKQFNFGDLRSIRPSAQGASALCIALAHFVGLRMSKSQIVEACELFNELYEMRPFELPRNLDRDQVLNFLREARFPESLKKDSDRQRLVKSKKWPLKSNVKWSRQGDLSGIEIKLFLTSPAEFKRALHDLNQIEVEDLWRE